MVLAIIVVAFIVALLVIAGIGVGIYALTKKSSPQHPQLPYPHHVLPNIQVPQPPPALGPFPSHPASSPRATPHQHQQPYPLPTNSAPPTSARSDTGRSGTSNAVNQYQRVAATMPHAAVQPPYAAGGSQAAPYNQLAAQHSQTTATVPPTSSAAPPTGPRAHAGLYAMPAASAFPSTAPTNAATNATTTNQRTSGGTVKIPAASLRPATAHGAGFSAGLPTTAASPPSASPQIVPLMAHATSPRQVATRGAEHQFVPKSSQAEVTQLMWVPPGGTVRVAGYDLHGGMLYVGNTMPALANPETGNDPALVNPQLPVAPGPTSLSRDESMSYWPAYGSISAQARANYLSWLANGRQNPNTDIGYVFLFFYGLERRVFTDCRSDAAASAELPFIAAEVHRLLDIYGENNSFRGYATAFLRAIAAMTADARPVDYSAFAWEEGVSPSGLDVALGRAARNAAPVPSNWALAWAVSQSSLRMPARRCPVEFESLFHLQYRLAFGDGFVPEGRVQKQVFSYRPSSSTFGQAELTVPVDGLPSATDPGYCRIIDIVERCMTDLDPFSRWRGKHPDGPVTMDGLAFLPVGLVLTYPTAFPPEIQAFRQLLESALARTDIATDIAPDIATVDSKGVLSHWPMADLAKPTKAEAIQFAQVCERLGFGVEPDIRFGGASPLTGNSLVLFRLGVDAPSEPSPEYKSAALVLLLMAAVIHADGVVTSEERTQMEAQAAYVSGLSSAEHVRIRAHAEWLLASPPSLTGLKKRLSALPATVRDDLADFLVAAATADGEVSPEEVTVIKRMFAMLGLDSASMYSRLHAAVAEIAPSADAPVRVSTGGPERLFAISEPPPVESPFDRSQTRTQEPDTSARSKPLSAQSATPSKPKRVTFALDMTAIQQKLAESARVAEILSGIFDDEAEKPVALSAPPLPQSAGVPVSSSASSGETIWTLDAKHSSLLRALLGHDSWSRDAVEDLCASFNLLTDGALETINEAAFDAVGEPVIEGSDPLELNKYALETIVP